MTHERSDRRASISSTRGRCSCTSKTPTPWWNASCPRWRPGAWCSSRRPTARPPSGPRRSAGRPRPVPRGDGAAGGSGGRGPAAWRPALAALGFVDVHDDVRDDLLTGASPAAAFWRETLETIRPIVTDPAHMEALGRTRRRRRELRRHDRPARRPGLRGALRGPAPGLGRAGRSRRYGSRRAARILAPRSTPATSRRTSAGAGPPRRRAGPGPPAPPRRPRRRPTSPRRARRCARWRPPERGGPARRRSPRRARPPARARVTWSPATWTKPPCTAARSSVPSSCWNRTTPGTSAPMSGVCPGMKAASPPSVRRNDSLDLFLEQDALGGDEAGGKVGIGRSPTRRPVSSERAFSRTDSTPPTLRNACSGTSSRSPLSRTSKDSTVSAIGTVTPFSPVNTSPTLKGCDRKRWILRARFTVSRSSSDSSSRPRMAMMSWSSR